MINFATWLAAQRKSKNLTQQELAERLGMHSRSISTWEIGKGRPNRNTMKRIEAEFGILPGMLIRAVFDKKGHLPAIDSSATEITLSPMLSNKIRQLSKQAAMSPEQWLDQ